jgi:hypothetical protein
MAKLTMLMVLIFTSSNFKASEFNSKMVGFNSAIVATGSSS